MIRRRDALGRAAPCEEVTKWTWHWRAQKFRKDRCEGEGRRHHYELHVHHLDHDYRNCDPANLQTLCRWCHMKVHGKRSTQAMGWKLPRNRR